MASMEAHDWWADVQSHRDELDGRRRVAVWTDDDLDMVPARILDRPMVSDELAARRGRRFVRAEEEERPAPAEAEPDFFEEDRGQRFRFVRTEHDPAARPTVDELDALTTAAPPVPGERRTVRITGRPEAATAPVPAARRQAGQRRPPISTRERVQHRPDRIALWAAMLGFLLIIIAFTSSDASAATALVAR